MSAGGPGGGQEPVAEALEEVWHSTAAACEFLSVSDWDHATDCPGWSVQDQLSHVIGIERTLMGDEPPEPVDAEHVRNAIGASNEGWVASRRRCSGAETLEEFRSVTESRLAELASLSPDDWERVGWTPIGEVPYRRFMWLRVMDSWVHEQDIRRALGLPGGRGGAGEAETLRHLASFMPYVVGRQVRPPDGTTVAWELGGPNPGDRPDRVVVEMHEGRGRLLGQETTSPASAGDADGASEPGRSEIEAMATVTLRLGPMTFWRLACGRPIGDDVIEVEGEEGLAGRVIAAMNVMV